MIGALHAEWSKLRTLRSTYVILAATLALGLGVSVLGASSTAAHWDTLPAADRAAFDPIAQSFEGFQYGQLVLVLLGVLVIGAEYGTGEIRSTLAATPRRWAVYAAKAIVLATLTLTISMISAFAAFLLCQQALAGKNLDVGLGAPHALRSVLVAGLYMTVVTMVGFGLAAFLRSTAAASTAAFGLIFLAWPAARAVEGISPLPNHLVLLNAAKVLVSTHPPTGPHADRLPSPAMAALDLVLYLAAFLTLGLWRVTRDP